MCCLDCVEAAGLSVDEARMIIEQRTFEQAVDDETGPSRSNTACRVCRHTWPAAMV